MDELNNIFYHDSSLIGISIDFDHSNFKIVFIESITGRKISIIFEKIYDLKMEHLIDIEDVEISSVSYSEEQKNYSTKIRLLLGFGKPSCDIDFKFKNAIVSFSD